MTPLPVSCTDDPMPPPNMSAMLPIGVAKVKFWFARTTASSVGPGFAGQAVTETVTPLSGSAAARALSAAPGC